MSATEFQTLILGWLAAIGTIAGVAVPLYFKIRAQIEENNKRLDKHDDLQNVCTKTDPSTKP